MFADEEPLKKAVEIRLNPMKFQEDINTAGWLKSLGPVIQRYADVLELELQKVNEGSEA